MRDRSDLPASGKADDASALRPAVDEKHYFEIRITDVEIGEDHEARRTREAEDAQRLAFRPVVEDIAKAFDAALDARLKDHRALVERQLEDLRGAVERQERQLKAVENRLDSLQQHGSRGPLLPLPKRG